MVERSIPIATAKRLSLYYRYLRILHETGTLRISSTELSNAVKIDSATIRRDFSYFGALGKRGYGYDVGELMQFFSKILNQDQLTNVAIVGVGNLGHALLHYNFRPNNSIRISAGFDVNPKLIGNVFHSIPIYSVEEMVSQLIDQQIKVAILTVPSEAAQEATDLLIEGGVQGILNFTPIRLTVPSNVRVHQVDLTSELQTLIYFIHTYSDGALTYDDSEESSEEKEDNV